MKGVWLYGTLRPGGARYRIVRDATEYGWTLGPPEDLDGYIMRDWGAWPSAERDDGWITAQPFDPPAEPTWLSLDIMLDHLDEIEGVAEGLFVRSKHDGRAIYLAGPKLLPPPRIVSGDWIAHSQGKDQQLKGS